MLSRRKLRHISDHLKQQDISSLVSPFNNILQLLILGQTLSILFNRNKIYRQGHKFSANNRFWEMLYQLVD